MLSENTKNKIKKWAEAEPLVTRAYIFGSRARNDYTKNSDLDVAVELEKPPGDGNLLGTWIGVGQDMQKRLANVVTDYKIHLQWFDGGNTPTILSGINRSSYIVYDANE